MLRVSANLSAFTIIIKFQKISVSERIYDTDKHLDGSFFTKIVKVFTKKISIIDV